MTFYVFSNAVSRKCRPSSKDQADHIDATTTSRGDTALDFEMSCGIWLWCRCGVPRLWTKVGRLVGHRNSGTHRGLTRIDFEPFTGQRSLTVFTDHRARSAFALKLHYFDSNQSVNF